MMMDWTDLENGLPTIFAFLIWLCLLVYMILDGYDLGVGMLSRLVNGEEKNQMIRSIGPFWDSNETWLVLGSGLLLVTFPEAHSVVLTKLYLPVSLMVVALVYRGVSYDIRQKVPVTKKRKWEAAFFVSSLIVAFTQGYIIGRFCVGFEETLSGKLFGVFFGCVVVSGYLLMGATWILLKCEGSLQKRAVVWTHRALVGVVSGVIMSACLLAFLGSNLYTKLFSASGMSIAITVLVVALSLMLFIWRTSCMQHSRWDGWPFLGAVLLFFAGGVTLAYSVYPYIVPGVIRIADASASKQSLMIIFVGALVVFPFLVGYTILSYRIFRGKVGDSDED